MGTVHADIYTSGIETYIILLKEEQEVGENCIMRNLMIYTLR
jgi:hypothetical protein